MPFELCTGKRVFSWFLINFIAGGEFSRKILFNLILWDVGLTRSTAVPRLMSINRFITKTIAQEIVSIDSCLLGGAVVIERLIYFTKYLFPFLSSKHSHIWRNEGRVVGPKKSENEQGGSSMKIDFSHAILTRAICHMSHCAALPRQFEAPISSSYYGNDFNNTHRGLNEREENEFIEYFINIMSNQGVEERIKRKRSKSCIKFVHYFGNFFFRPCAVIGSSQDQPRGKQAFIAYQRSLFITLYFLFWFIFRNSFTHSCCTIKKNGPLSYDA